MGNPDHAPVRHCSYEEFVEEFERVVAEYNQTRKHRMLGATPSQVHRNKLQRGIRARTHEEAAPQICGPAAPKGGRAGAR